MAASPEVTLFTSMPDADPRIAYFSNGEQPPLFAIARVVQDVFEDGFTHLEVAGPFTESEVARLRSGEPAESESSDSTLYEARYATGVVQSIGNMIGRETQGYFTGVLATIVLMDPVLAKQEQVIG